MISYVVFKDLTRYNVLIGKCEWTHKTKYRWRIYKKKQEINTNKSSVKYGQVIRPYKKWIQKKPFMLSCITTLITLIIFVLCAGKFSPSNKSNPPLKDFLYVHVGAIFYESCRIPSQVFSSVFSINFLKILWQVFFRYHFFGGEGGGGDGGEGVADVEKEKPQK